MILFLAPFRLLFSPPFMCPSTFLGSPYCYSNSLVFAMHSEDDCTHRFQKQWEMRGVSATLSKESHLANNTQTKAKRTRVVLCLDANITFKKREWSLQGVLHEIGLCSQILRWISFVSGCNALVLIKKTGRRECLTKKVISLVTGVKSPLSAFLPFA